MSERSKTLMRNRGDKNDWLLILADCEARVRHTQPDVADELRDLRWEMRDAVRDIPLSETKAASTEFKPNG